MSTASMGENPTGKGDDDLENKNRVATTRSRIKSLILSHWRSWSSRQLSLLMIGALMAAVLLLAVTMPPQRLGSRKGRDHDARNLSPFVGPALSRSRAGSSSRHSRRKLLQSSSSSRASSSDSKGGGSDTINFTLARVGYAALTYFNDEKTPVKNYKFLDGFMAIIEPHVDMELEVYDDGDSSSNTFYYTICPTSTDDAGVDEDSCQTGVKADSDASAVVTVNFPCEPFDTFDISVEEYNTKDALIRSTTASGICMYVRREIRDLAGTDLDAFLDAAYTLWSVSEEEGQELYGENFHSNSYIVKLHHFNAAWQGKVNR
jgi:hypothetical protein